MTDVDLILTLATRVKRLREELADAEGQLLKAIAGKDSKPQADTVATRVRRFLARNGPSSFADVLKGVQPAEKFAVRSALNKGRTRGEFSFADDLYSLETKNPGPAKRRNRG